MDRISNDHDQPGPDENWRSVGLPDRAIRAARAAFSSPDRAAPWVPALQQYVPEPEVLRDLVNSGVRPNDFVRWRKAGVDSRNIVAWSQLFSEAGLEPERVVQWRAAHLNVLTLPLMVPYLSKDFDFDDALGVLGSWDVVKPSAETPRAEQLLRVLEAGLSGRDVLELDKTGVAGEQLVQWSSSGVPAVDWVRWVSLDIPPEVATRFAEVGVAAGEASNWLKTGLSADASLALMGLGVALQTVHEWIEAGVSATDAASFLKAGASLQEAREWSTIGLSARDAALFIDAHIAVEDARPWIGPDTGLNPGDAVEFIEKGVPLTRAHELVSRGIEPHQVTRTDSGFELDLYPWQEDPADRLPEVIEPGHVGLWLWSTAAGGDYVAYDVSFTWDGKRSADWYQDISMMGNSLSPGSSSPIHGTAAWPEGKDVALTYEWPELGYEGTDTLPGVAPTAALPDSDGGPSNPQSWIRLGYALIEWVYQTF